MATVMTACKDGQTEGGQLAADNPFLKESTLPYKTIPFDKISDSDFEPAFLEGMRLHALEIDSIAHNPEAPTFENTLVAMERSGQLLQRVQLAFGVLTSANTNEKLQAVDEAIAPKLSAHFDAIYLNEKLFDRVKTLFTQRDQLDLDAESRHLVEHYYKTFEKAGANLNAADKERLKKLNEEEASLTTKFANLLLEGTKAGGLWIDDEAELAGLSESEIEAAAAAAKAAGGKGKYLLPLQNTTQQPALASLSNRETRKRLFDASWSRSEKGDAYDTREIITRLASLRAEKAAILGFADYASWKLQDQMAKNPENVARFLNQLIPASTSKAKAEAEAIREAMRSAGADFELQAWDWDYYAGQVKKARFDLDDNVIKPYFVLDSVLLNGVFYAATRLYGITFKQRTDLPVYHEDVRVWEVFEEQGEPLGLFYGDFFKRSNKSGGAWMSNLVEQSKLMGTKPVIYNVCNYTKPAAGQPALISFDDVITLFHEFGHALHGMFAEQQFPSLSGTNVPRDFVEFPSQFNEHWALYPDVLKNYAKHYETGDPLPQELIDKIKAAATFNQGYALTEFLAAAALDMEWHTLDSAARVQGVEVFEKTALEKNKLALDQIPPRYRSSYFRHIWSNGYSAAYYAYSWAEMLDHDAYVWFEENGGLNRENGQVFREKILSRGNTEDFESLYKNFRGKAPSIQPLLRFRGLLDKG